MKIPKYYELVTWERFQRWKLAQMKKIFLRSTPRAFVLVEHRNSDGKLLYHNSGALIDQGEQYILESFFQGNNTPTAFKLDLATDASIGETVTTYTPVTGAGSGKKSLVRNNTDFPSVLSGGDWRVTSRAAAAVWTNTDSVAWVTANSVVLLATISAVDKLIAYSPLSVARTVEVGDTLTSSVIVSLG